MNNELDLERRRLDLQAQHYQKEMLSAAHGLRASIQLVPPALRVARHLAPALPYAVAVVALGALVVQLRARNLPRVLLIGGALIDAIRIWALSRPAQPLLAVADAAGSRRPVNAAEAR